MSISRPAVLRILQCRRRLGLVEGNASRVLGRRRFVSSSSVTSSRIAGPSERPLHIAVGLTSRKRSLQPRSCFPRAKRRFSASTTAAHGHVEPPRPGEEYVSFTSVVELLSKSPLARTLSMRSSYSAASIADLRAVQNSRHIYRQGG
jgi:hypothetical protein